MWDDTTVWRPRVRSWCEPLDRDSRFEFANTRNGLPLTQPLRCPYDATLCQLPRCIGQGRCSLDRRRGPGPSSERLPRVKVPDPERNAAERATLLRAALLMMARVIVVLDQGDQRLSVQARRLE